jgi:hypothetical protein
MENKGSKINFFKASIFLHTVPSIVFKCTVLNVAAPAGNRKNWRSNRKKPVVKQMQQKYNSSDLYKPRTSFSSKSRSRSEQEK